MNGKSTVPPGSAPHAPLPSLPNLRTERKIGDSSDSDNESIPHDMYTPRGQSMMNPFFVPPSPGTRAAAELHEMYRSSPPTGGRLSSQAKLSILAEKQRLGGHGGPSEDEDDLIASMVSPIPSMSPPISPLPVVSGSHRMHPLHTAQVGHVAAQAAAHARSRSASNMSGDLSLNVTDGSHSNRTSSNSISGNNLASPQGLSISIGGHHAPPEGFSSSNTPMSQNSSKSQRHTGSMEALGAIARDAETIAAYLRQAMSLKKIDILKEAKTKADLLFANPIFVAARERVQLQDRTDPSVEITLQSLENLFSIYATFEPEIKRLSAESIDIIKYYLRQGVQQRNRDMIKEALLRLSHVDRALVEKSLLGPAEEMIKELDAQYVTVQYLVSATVARDGTALDDAINKARLLNMREEECKELADATRMQIKLREKSEKENSRRVAGFVTKFFKNTKEKSEKKGDSVSGSKAIVKRQLFGSELHEVTAFYSRSVSAHPLVQGSASEGEEEKTKIEAEKEHASKSVEVPVIVADCMDYILKHNGRDEAGIFRLAGNRDIMAHIVGEYDAHFSLAAASPGSVNITNAFVDRDRDLPPSPSSELNDVNDAANILKQFLRALPEPLIPFTAYTEWVQLGQKLRQTESDENIEALRVLCAKLPIQCNNLLQYLAFHLAYITENSDVNKMTEHNLAIVFAPNLLRPKVDTHQTLISDSPVTILIIAAAIKYASRVF